jgi:hypothetical protein
LEALEDLKENINAVRRETGDAKMNQTEFWS